MNNKQCAVCRYFVNNQQDVKKGTCHKNPPIPYPLVSIRQNVVGGKPEISVDGVLSFFPIVTVDSFCGQWEPTAKFAKDYVEKDSKLH